MNDHEERLIDLGLEELLGGQEPPDLTQRILSAADRRATRFNVFGGVAVAASLLFAGFVLWTVMGAQDGPDRLISRLADEDVAERERAATELRRLGVKALPDLDRARQSDNAQVAARAQRVYAEVALDVMKRHGWDIPLYGATEVFVGRATEVVLEKPSDFRGTAPRHTVNYDVEHVLLGTVPKPRATLDTRDPKLPIGQRQAIFSTRFHVRASLALPEDISDETLGAFVPAAKALLSDEDVCLGELAADLGSEDPARREAVSLELRRFGIRAFPQLKRQGESADLEVRSRARDIHDQICLDFVRERGWEKYLYRARLVFIGSITEVGRAPGVWSGICHAMQPVTYAVVRVLMGFADAPSAIVHYSIVGGQPIVDEQPRLRPELFKEGTTGVIFAGNYYYDRWQDVTDYPPLPIPDNVPAETLQEILVSAKSLLGQDPLYAKESIDELLEKLGDDDPRVRDQASAQLVQIGRPALEPLRRAAASDQPEVAGRARSLIDEIDWPEPGPAKDGLAIAIKAEQEYPGKYAILLRGRLENISDNDIVIVGANRAADDESDTFLMNYDGRGEKLHLCWSNRRAAFPELPETITLRKGQRMEFSFSPRAWCFSAVHEKCNFLKVTPGEHRLSIALNIPKAAEGEWKGTVQSNEVTFVVKE
ncbi:MAG: HEAT repeat domain-containing protein [Planctomycetes bacterium]|nr:HEAT repeat domain-containing protein [Planctomycetota bacterium]